MSVKSVSDADFSQSVLNNSKPVLVDFWAEWCGPCRMVSPILDQLASEYHDKIEVVKVNVDENPQLAMNYHVTSIPALKVFKDGSLVHSSVGARPKVALEEDLAEFLK